MRSSLVVSVNNLSIPRFVTLRSVCYFFKVETASQWCSYVVNRCYCKYL